MKNLKKTVVGVATALCLLAAPSGAIAAENGTWDYVDTYNLPGGWTNYLTVYTGGGDVRFCVTNTTAVMGFKLRSTTQEFGAQNTTGGSSNCAIFRSVGGAGYLQLTHRYTQPDLTISYWD